MNVMVKNKIMEMEIKLAKACFNSLGYDDVKLDDGFYSGVLDGKREYIFLDPKKQGILVIATVKDADVEIRYSRVDRGYYERIRFTFVNGELIDRDEYISYNENFGKELCKIY